MEKRTFNQINEQESSAYRRGSDALPSVLIQRSDLGITVGNLDKHTGNVLFTEDGVYKMHPNVPLERLTDEHQQKLATLLAGKVLRGVELASEAPATEGSVGSIDKINATLDELRRSMLETDRVPAWQYATALYDYELNNALGKLSPEGRNQARIMRDLYERRQALQQHPSE